MKNYTHVAYICGLHSISTGFIAKSALQLQQGEGAGPVWVGGRRTARAPALHCFHGHHERCRPPHCSCPGRPGVGRTQGGRQSKKLQQPHRPANEHVRTERQGQAEASLPRIVLFWGSGSCLGCKLWDEKVITHFCLRRYGRKAQHWVLYALGVPGRWRPPVHRCSCLIPVTDRRDRWQSRQMWADVLRPYVLWVSPSAVKSPSKSLVLPVFFLSIRIGIGLRD